MLSYIFENALHPSLVFLILTNVPVATHAKKSANLSSLMTMIYSKFALSLWGLVAQGAYTTLCLCHFVILG